MKHKKSFEKGGDFLSPKNHRFLRRETKIFFGVVSLVLFAVMLGFVLNANCVVAEEPQMPDVLGISPDSIDKLPESPEELANTSSSYLKKEWQKILVNSSIIGPIHRWSMNHQGFYQFVFNENYDTSLKFFLVFVFWFFIFIFIANIFEAPEAFGFGGSIFPGIIVGFLSSLVLAHLKVINILVAWIIKIKTFASGVWWKGLIFWAILIIILVFIYSFGDAWKKSREKAKEIAEKREVKTSIKESKAFIKGVEEGQELTKDFRKIKKKAFLDEGAGI